MAELRCADTRPFRHNFTAIVLAVGAVLCACPPCSGQVVIQKILGEGDPAPGVPGVTIADVSRPGVNANGQIAFRATTSAVFDNHVYYVGTTPLVAVGDPSMNSGGGLFSNMLPIHTAHQINDSGDVIFASFLSGVPFSMIRALHINDAVAVQKGQLAPGLPDVRTFDNFLSPGLLNDGRYGFCALLDYSVTTNNQVIYFDGSPLPMNAHTIFREDEFIVGGPLDGEQWGQYPFSALDWNNNGDVLINCKLAGSQFTERAIVFKPVASDYQLHLRKGQLLPVPSGGALPFELATEIKLNDSGEWVLLGQVNANSPQQNVAIAKLGLAAPRVIMQLGDDASVATGDPGTVFGGIVGVSINNSGDVLVVAYVAGGAISYNQAVFRYSGGAFSMLFNDRMLTPSGPAWVVGKQATLAADGSVAFQACVNGDEGIYRAVPPPVEALQNLSCDQITGTTDVALTWDHPAGQSYSAIRVFVGGVAQPDLPGTASSFVTTLGSTREAVRFTVVGVESGDLSSGVSCNTAVPAIPDHVVCSAPATPILDLQPVADPILVTQVGSIRDMYVDLRVAHPFIGDLNPVALTSPSGTTVTLMSSVGGTENGIRSFFSDAGVPAGSVPYSVGAFVQPIGPGMLSDFFCEPSGGTWELSILDDGFENEGSLDEWCLGFDYQNNPATDCCERPQDFLGVSWGQCGVGEVLLYWTNPTTYFGLELTRTDDLGASVVIPLAPTDTVYADATVIAGTTYEYRLHFTCASGGTVNAGPSCRVFARTNVPPVVDLACDLDFCAQVVTLSWDDQGVLYDRTTLLRDGVTLVTLTGQTTFTDTAPLSGLATYTLVSECAGMASAPIECTVDTSFQPPAEFLCQSDPVTGDVSISWVNQGVYTTMSLFRNGFPVVPQPAPGDVAYLDTNPAVGCNEYVLVTGCAASSGRVECSLADFLPGNDYLMIPESTGGTVGLYDPTCGAYVGELIASGATSPMTLEAPVCAILGADDRIYLSDQLGNRVYRFNRHGTLVDVFADAFDGLSNIRGLDFDASGNLLVADDEFVAAFDPAGMALPHVVLDHSEPTDVHVLPNGRLLVSNAMFPWEVRNYQANGQGFTSAVSSLRLPLQINDLDNGSFVVTSFEDDTITEFDATAGIVQTIAVEAGPRGVYELENGKWLYTTSVGVWCVDPATGNSTQIRGGIDAHFVELLPGAAPSSKFVRGDCNADDRVNIADAVRMMSVLFPTACTPGVDCPEFECADACDANDDGSTNIADVVFCLSVLFPMPCTSGVNCPDFADPSGVCGYDPTMDMLGCDSFSPCP
ncbi:MAG: proprotein convertase P-domain-containing protein [Planctomycetota bacterium]